MVNRTGRLFVIKLSAFRCDKRHDRDGAGALNRDGQFSLVSGAVARNSAGHDFAAFRNKVIQNDRIFEIDLDIRVRAEPAEFFSVEKFLLGRTRWSFTVGYSHDYSPFF